MTAFVFTSYAWGDGKTVQAVSFVPNIGPNYDGKRQVVRYMVDPELRAESVTKAEGMDEPEKMRFVVTRLNPTIFTANFWLSLVKKVRNTTLRKEGGFEVHPDVLILDDMGMIAREIEARWINDVNYAKALASLYGFENNRAFPRDEKNWRGSDPQAHKLLQRLTGLFIVDCRACNIDVIITSPTKNVWQDFGKKGTAPDGLPFMRILGGTVDLWDGLLQQVDIIWNVSRHDPKGNRIVRQSPIITMDLFSEKNSFPGTPEKFEWPGWPEVWKWHNERTYIADTSKLVLPEPQFSPEQEEELTNRGKQKLVIELAAEGITLEDIKRIISDPDMPYQYNWREHQEAKAYIMNRFKQEQIEK